MDLITLAVAKKGAKTYTDQQTAIVLDEAKDYTDTRVDSIIPGFDYKGSVATIEDLPSEGQTKGDCYNVTTGNLGVYVWNGTAWTSASKAGPQGIQGPTGPQGPKGEDGAHTISVSETGTSTNQVNYITIDGTESKLPQGTQVSVSSTGTSTNDVRYITIDGAESRFTSVALRAMKSAWVTGTTLEAANAILNDDSVVAGDGFLATVYWSDLPGDLTQAEVKAFVMKKSGSYQKIIQFECTSGTVAPYSWFYNSYEKVWRSQVPLNDTVTSTSANEALTANMGKVLQDQVNNLKNIGRFLAIWDCSTGLPLTDPVTTGTYSYRTGDYFRVGVVSSATPAVNYKPNGSSYTPGTASTTTETEDVEIGWVYYYDGSQWLAQSAGGGGLVQDVQVNGTSVVDSGTGVASIPLMANNVYGVVKINGAQALRIDGSGNLYIDTANSTEIMNKAGSAPIKPQNINDTIKSGVGNYTGTAFTDAEKTTGRNLIGAIALEEYNSSASTYAEGVLYYVVEN